MFRAILRFLRLSRPIIRRDVLIYHYADGTKDRSADPVVIERALIKLLGENWRDTVATIGKPINEQIIGEERDALEIQKEENKSAVCHAICVAFDVKRYKDGEGLVEPELMYLLERYMDYAAGLVELARPFLRPQSRASPSPESPITTNGAESTLTATK